MKKALKAELISLAHKILQLKGKKDVSHLKEISRQVYEKLSILEFTEAHFEGSKPTIGRNEVEEILAEEEAVAAEPKKGKTPEERSKDSKPKKESPQPETPKENVEPRAEQEESVQTPKTPVQKEKPATSENPQPAETSKKQQELTEKSSVEDAGIHYDDLPQFEPVQKQKASPKPAQEYPAPNRNTEDEKQRSDLQENPPQEQQPSNSQAPSPDLFSPEKRETKNNSGQQQFSLNDRLKKGIQIGLNDRMAYIKHLFDGDASDYNRVLSQLNTMNSFQEAEQFIKQKVKPDYNWKEEEKYETRFMETVENRFS